MSPWWRNHSGATLDTQQTQSVSLTEYVSATAWLENEAGPFFVNRSSFDWFRKSHRTELVEAGALIPGRGRTESLVHPARMARAVIEIRKRDALNSRT